MKMLVQSIVIALVVATSAQAQYLQIVRENDTPKTMETSIVSYESKDGTVQVDLISAVHMGERSYYEELNKEFENYDVLLYELVAPKGTVVPKGGKRPDNMLAIMQRLMGVMLGLSSQTNVVDYSKSNFVHADISPQELQKAIIGSLLTSDFNEVFAQIEQTMAQTQQPQQQIQSPKLQMALQLEEQMKNKGGLTGISFISEPLISTRNQAALSVMGQQIAQGKKKMAIFYGAAHMPDFHTRLTKDYGFQKKNERWIVAWDLSKDTGDPFEQLFKALESLE